MVTTQVRTELKRNIRVMALLFLVLFAIIVVRAWFLQVLRSQELTRMLQNQHTTSVLLTPKRGTIYDRSGSELAVSIQVESLFARPHLISRPERVAGQLAGIFGTRRTDILKKLRIQKSFVWLQRKITPQQAQAIRALNEPGLDFVKESKRFYPNSELAGHLIGFTGMDSEGLEGLEFEFDSALRGTPRRLVVSRDARGHHLFAEGFSGSTQGMGSDLYLTIDKNIQYIAEKELQAAVSISRAKNGIAIVMDPWSGDVLALAISPSFDPNKYFNYQPEIWRNRAVADVFEPGSTFKTFLVAAALEEKMIKPQDIFFCENGSYKVANKIIHDVHPHGWLNVSHILKYSSNIGASKISRQLGKDLFYQYIRKFGFAQETGVSFPGEAAGSVPLPYRISEHTQSAIAFGQGISVTPLQLATAYSAIANGGVLMKPHLVKQIRNASGDLRQVGKQYVRQRVIDTKTARRVTEMLTSVTSAGGTGEKATVAGFTVAGKTGTSQKLERDHSGYCSKRSVASFAGFCPADNPRITVVVIIDEPEVMSYGGQIAAPVFSRVSQLVMNYLHVAPETRVEIGAQPWRETKHTLETDDIAG